MDFLENVFEFGEARLAAHFPFLVYVFTFAFLGQVAKRFLWTEKRIRKMAAKRDALWNDGGKFNRFRALFFKVILAIPLPLHPLIVGLFLSLFPGLPMSDGVPDTFMWRALYMAGAALLSLSLYDIVHGVTRKHGLEVRLPGEAPPPIPTVAETPRAKRGE